MLTILLGTVIGGALGAFVGWKGRCTTGACPLTSNPYMGGMYGAVVGALLASLSVQSAIPPEPSPSAGVSESTEATVSAIRHATTPEAFDRILRESPTPVLVDFGASWCPPCQIQDEVLETIAEDFSGRVTILKVDVDEVPSVAIRHQVQALPTLLLFEEGKVVHRAIGIQSETVLRDLLAVDSASGPTPLKESISNARL